MNAILMPKLSVGLDRCTDSDDWHWWLVDGNGETISEGVEPSEVEAEIRAIQIREFILENDSGGV